MNSGIIVTQIIIGIICCLFGLKFQKVIIALIGLIVGFSIGDYIVQLFGITGGLDLVLRVGLALVFGACSFGLFETLMALIVGFSIFTTVVNMFGGIWYVLLLGIILGIIGGLIVCKYYKVGIILFTSFVGSQLITSGLLNYLQYSQFLVFVIIFVFSVIIQMTTNKIKL